MGGGLMQLVAYGAQDIYLTGNPQITFFKVVYRRHTNFSMELIEQTLNGSVAASARLTATISRNGDLVHRMYVNWNPDAAMGNATDVDFCYPSFTLLKEVEVEIGGQQIDKHYGHWLTAYHELTSPNTACSFPSICTGSGAVTGGAQFATSIPVNGTGGTEIPVRPTQEQAMAFHCKCTNKAAVLEECSAWVPLQFWFNRNPGLALPLIALQYHEVKCIIQLCTDAQLFAGTNTAGGISLSELKLWAEYIYLDTDERRRFAQVSHEYLIEQLQFQNSAPSTSIDLNFNHPVKELIFSGDRTSDGGPNGSIATHTRLKISGSGDAREVKASAATGTAVGLKLNGHDRFAAQHLDYFTRTQVWQHHTGNGGVQKTDSLAVYSFALKPEEHQPSGTCNFSRIDNAQLTFSNSPQTGVNVRVYAVNYNVLRIMSGMGGLAYSN
jgi:hypothetical protein